MTERLTTLAAVKDWLGIANSDSDEQLIRVINAASQFALNYMSRDSLQSRQYTQNFKGNGKNTMLLRNWPVTAISSVGVAGRLITPSTFGTGGMPTAGYYLSDDRAAPQSLELYGFCFQWNAPCQVIYSAGFEGTTTFSFEAATDFVTFVPTDLGQWTKDLGVTVDGTPLVKSATDQPSAGQYYVDEWGTYTFSPLDAQSIFLIAYSYAPWDVAFGVTQVIGEWWKRKDRIGVSSKSLGGQETVSFSMQDMNDAVRSMIQPYRNVVPV